MVQNKPPDTTLSVHLKNEQNVVYKAHTTEAEEFLQHHIDTPITGYFHINQMESKLSSEPDPQNLKEILYEDCRSYFFGITRISFGVDFKEGNK